MREMPKKNYVLQVGKRREVVQLNDNELAAIVDLGVKSSTTLIWRASRSVKPVAIGEELTAARAAQLVQGLGPKVIQAAKKFNAHGRAR
jgi:hypothetical protein